MHRFTADDDRRGGYTYTVGICTTAMQSAEAADERLKTAGAIQQQKQQPDNSGDTRTHVLGSFEHAEIMSGRMFHKRFSSFIFEQTAGQVSIFLH